MGTKVFLGKPSAHVEQWIKNQRLKEPLCFTAVDAGATITFNKVGSPDSARIVTSTDGQNWTPSPYTFGTTITLANVGDKVYFRAADENDISFYKEWNAYYKFATTDGKRIAASGNIQTLMKADGSRLDISGKNKCYEFMFQDCTSLTTAPALPATTLAPYCYYGMFSRCSSLTVAPAVPATTLADSCYESMFNYCTSLTTAPATLPAQTLADHCCQNMFYNCTSLTTAPALPATTLADHCCYQMFNNCTSLTTAPALPATTLAPYCYQNMFNGCSSLTTAPSLSATTLADHCCYYMFDGCTSLTTAPALPATTLAPYCYQNMFIGCEQLTMLTLPATAFADYCYDNIVDYGQYQNLIYFQNADLEDLVDAYKEYYIFGEWFDDFDIVCRDGQTYTMSMSLMETQYEFYDNYVYYHGPYGEHSESESDVIGEITSSEYDLNDSHSITIRFNGSELIHGFDEEITFNIDVDNSDISYNIGGYGYASAGSLNEHELGCFNFWSFNGDSDDIWVRIPIQEIS